MFQKLFVLAAALLCVACGNADRGAPDALKRKNVAQTVLNNSQAAQSALQQLSCKTLQVSSAGDATFNQLFTGSSVCFSQAAPAITYLKVNSYIGNRRYCLIPVQGGNYGQESCFPMTGYQVNVNLQSGTYDALVLVDEIYLAAYKMHLTGQSNTQPPLAIAIR